MALADLTDNPLAQAAAAAGGMAAPEAESVVEDQADTTTEAAEPPPESQIAMLLRWADPVQTVNIAAEIDMSRLGGLGQKVVEEYDIDDQSRENWKKDAKAALELALQRAKPKNYPWSGASNIVIPMITEAADQFAARAYPAIIDDSGVVKGKIYGLDEGTPLIDPQTGQPVMRQDPASGQPVPEWKVPPGAKKKRADNIGRHMSWQLLEEQPEWESDTDQMLHMLPVVGCHFRKSFFDPVMGRNMSVGVSGMNLVVNYWAKSLDTAPRATEELRLYPYEIQEYEATGFFLKGDFGYAQSDANDPDAAHLFLEQHRRFDLDGDGYPEPYIVTVHKDTAKVVRIAARYDADGIRFGGKSGKEIVKIVPVQYYTKYDFLPNKEGGFYGMGLGHALKSLNESANTTLNMIFDGAHLQSQGGGFIGKGLSMQTGTVKVGLGEWKTVNAPGNDIRNAIVPLQHQGPSPVLFQVLGLIMEAGKSISSVKDVLTGDIKAQTMSPTVFMALVEQGLKVFTSIWKRIRRSLKSEFDKLYRLNRLYLEDQTSYQIGDELHYIGRQDYEIGSGVEPMSDAAMVVDAQRMARAAFLQQFMNDPMFNGIEIRQRILDAGGIEEPEKLLNKNPSPDPMLISKMAELELKHIQVKAAAIAQLAAAMKSMADADATIQEPFWNWATLQFNAMKDQIDALDQQQGQQGAGSPAPGVPGPDAGNGQPVAPPPGDAGLAQILGGLPGGTAPAASGPMGTGQS